MYTDSSESVAARQFIMWGCSVVGWVVFAGLVVRDRSSVLDSGRSILLEVQTGSGSHSVSSPATLAPSVTGRNVKCT